MEPGEDREIPAGQVFPLEIGYVPMSKVGKGQSHYCSNPLQTARNDSHLNLQTSGNRKKHAL